jgi:hypothetical protein
VQNPYPNGGLRSLGRHYISDVSALGLGNGIGYLTLHAVRFYTVRKRAESHDCDRGGRRIYFVGILGEVGVDFFTFGPLFVG